MIKRKWSILFLLGLSFASVCQAGGDIDALYSRIAQKDIQALNELKALAKDNNAQALAELALFMSTALLCRKIRYRLSSIMSRLVMFKNPMAATTLVIFICMAWG